MDFISSIAFPNELIRGSFGKEILLIDDFFESKFCKKYEKFQSLKKSAFTVSKLQISYFFQNLILKVWNFEIWKLWNFEALNRWKFFNISKFQSLALQTLVFYKWTFWNFDKTSKFQYFKVLKCQSWAWQNFDFETFKTLKIWNVVNVSKFEGC